MLVVYPIISSFFCIPGSERRISEPSTVYEYLMLFFKLVGVQKGEHIM